MATTYVHPSAQASNARTMTSAGQPVIGHAYFKPNAALAVGDVVRMFQIPNGAKVINCLVRADDMDSGGSPTIAFNVGDTGSATRYFSATNVAQAGGVAELANGAAVKGYTYNADDVLTVTITAAAATPTLGGVGFEVFLTYYCTMT